MKFLTQASFRLLTLILCLAASVPQLRAYDYTIYMRYTGSGNASNVRLHYWNADNNTSWPGTTMEQVVINGVTYYKKSVTSSNDNIGVIFNMNSSPQTGNLTAYPGDNYFVYDGNTTAMTYYVLGTPASLFGASWGKNGTSLMVDNGNGTWTWTQTVELTSGTTYEYKVNSNSNQWYPNNSGNKTFTVPTSGTYTVTVTFDGTDVNHTVTSPTPTYYIVGDPGLGLTWNYEPETVMTRDGDTDVYTYSFTVTTPGTYYFAFADGQGSSWDDFNGNYRIGPSGNVAVTLGGDYSATGHGGGSYIATVGAGPVTIYLDATDPDNLQYRMEGVAPANNLYLIGYAGSQQWAANAGIPMKYDEVNGYFKLENVVLTSWSNFAFATTLANYADEWSVINANRLSSNGESNWVISDQWLDTWMDYVSYTSEHHNWQVEQSGAYDIYVNPSTHKVKVTRSHEDMYISYGIDWSYESNSVKMSTVDGNTYQTTITLNQGDYFLFSTQKSNESAWGAENDGYEITDLMVGFAQKLEEHQTNNYHFTGSTGKYIVIVNKEKGTVILRRAADATVTKIFLKKTDNVVLDPAGGTYNGQTLEGKRGGIYAWNKLNLQTQNGQTYTWAPNDGPTNYTYAGEVGNSYGGDNYLKDLPDTTTVDGCQWYAWSVANSICEFYFIRSNKQDTKSQKVIRRSGEIWLTWIDEDATFNRQDNAQHLDSLYEVTRDYYDVSASGVSDCATMLEGHYYVYYTNTTGWDSVYCYAWNETPLIKFTDDYPGNKCTFVGYDEDGFEVWCYDFGLIEQFGDIVPSNVIFDNGRGGANEHEEGDKVREQTGDLIFDNGACYDYLGMIYLGNSLNGIINTGIVNGPKYTVEDDLLGVYYDENAITQIVAKDKNNQMVTYEVKGALYAKDYENYSAKSRMPEGTTDYVYQICAHPKTGDYPGGSQIQIKRENYDQSNWVKIVLSPNFDNNNIESTDVTYDRSKFDNDDFESATADDRAYLEQYVGKIIPGGSMSGNLVNNVNPQMHITNIAKPIATQEYEKNVYITGHFNDSVVFSYVHKDWSPGIYNGVHKTVPEWVTNEQGQTVLERTWVTPEVYKMFYVAPKPQEVAYITWAVFDHPDSNVGTNNCVEEPDVPGAFYGPMNWNRTGDLWDGTTPPDPTGNAPWGTTYGPYSNGYMQYGAFQVNWSLFEGMEIPYGSGQGRPQEPWYRIFKPGQAYKILAIIRYAWGDDQTDVEYSAGVYKGNGYNEGNTGGDHVANAPRRANNWKSMEHVPFDILNDSKFIVFPLRGSSEDSYGDDVGNVTAVREVIQDVAAPRSIVSVHYFNLMGVESEQPHDGINVVVTTYSDGTRSTKKIVR